MARVLLTGATGTLGEALQPRLLAAGHAVRAASRSPPDGADGERAAATDGELSWVELDLASGAGLEAALADVDVVVHAATAPTGDTEAVDVAGTERLVAAAADAGVGNLVYPSIVGVDEVSYSYYDAKRTAERAVLDGPVPATVLRATQFHAFVADVLGLVARLPVWPLPTRFRLQPIAAGEVADALVEYATPEAHGRVDPVPGPEVHTVRELATAYRDARGLRRPVVRLPLPGAAARGFREGKVTRPDRAEGTVTWDEWLAAEYGDAERPRAAAPPS